MSSVSPPLAGPRARAPPCRPSLQGGFAKTHVPVCPGSRGGFPSAGVGGAPGDGPEGQSGDSGATQALFPSRGPSWGLGSSQRQAASEPRLGRTQRDLSWGWLARILRPRAVPRDQTMAEHSQGRARGLGMPPRPREERPRLRRVRGGPSRVSRPATWCLLAQAWSASPLMERPPWSRPGTGGPEPRL